MKKIKAYILAHKIISSAILLVFIGTSYLGYKKITSTAGDIRYLTAKVAKGTVIASISGSGQVSSLNQVDIKAKASGDVVYLAAQNGQKIRTGELIGELDDKDAEKSVRDAEVNLESAQISLSKLKIQNSSDNLNADSAKTYDDAFNTLSNAFLDLPGIMTGFDDMFFKNSATTGQNNINWYGEQATQADQDQANILKQDLIDSYNKATAAYNATFETYKTISRTSDNATIGNFVSQTYDTVKLISDAVKDANNYINFVNNSMQKNSFAIPAIIAANLASLNTYTSKINTHLSNLLADKTNIKNNTDAFPNADLDIQSAELSLEQKQNALQDAKDKLADYFIRAPFDGTLASINIKKSDSVSAGATVATLITTKQLAEISLNEVDVAKIKIGQKSTLTFDAIPELTISGVVADIDTVGTVSQGVVSYTTKLSFDTQDSRVKPGMSVSATIITDIRQDVLTVPNSAIKSQAGTSYIEMFDTPLPPSTDGLIGSISKTAPNKIPVEVGLTSDTESEITSGIKEGDEIVTRTITPSATTTTSAPSIFGGAGGNRTTGGGGVRIGTTGR